MKRKIIKINEELCNGCGACAAACHENAIAMVDGKARLIREDYCDGLGDCLPACPTGAISFEEREAAAELRPVSVPGKTLPCGCPGTQARAPRRAFAPVGKTAAISQLSQWPVQIKLVPVQAPYFENADLLIASDCTAYAYADFHHRFIRDRITLIGCPKLDRVDYSEKLTEIIKENSIKSLTVVRMEVPCCGGIEKAVKKALKNSGKMIPWQVVTITADGRILD